MNDRDRAAEDLARRIDQQAVLTSWPWLEQIAREVRALADTTPAPDVATAIRAKATDEAIAMCCEGTGECGASGCVADQARYQALIDAADLAERLPGVSTAPVTDEQAREQAAAAMQRVAEVFARNGSGLADAASLWAQGFEGVDSAGNWPVWLEAARALLGVSARGRRLLSWPGVRPRSDVVTALDPARIAAAFWTAAEAAEKPGVWHPLRMMSRLIETMPEDYAPEMLAAVAALIRGLAPEPDGELAEAEAWMRRTISGGYSTVKDTTNHLPALAVEYDRRGALLGLMKRLLEERRELERLRVIVDAAVAWGSSDDSDSTRALLDAIEEYAGEGSS